MTTVPFRVELERDVIVASGKDARTFLHSQLSNDVAALAVGGVTYAFILDPGGKLNAFFRVHCVADDRFVLDVDPGCGDAALARLNKFKIRVQCDFALHTQRIIAVRGLSEILAVPGAVSAWRSGDGAVDVFGDETSGVTEIRIGTQADYQAERVRCAWPIFGVDITDASLPAETGLIDVAVSFTKGCYPGQELVERMDSRGSTAPRTLRRLPAVMPESDGRTGGDVASTNNAVAGRSYRIGSIDIGTCTSVAGDYALVL
ncbi:MAG: YgfZ/GcvT domain-containing protein, partial [Ilumatobacteraceae bacterium]